MSNILLQEKYVTLLSAYLPKFKQMKRGLYLCRCPLCGDSSRNPNKRRFYLFPDYEHGIYKYKCHNCGLGGGLAGLMKQIAEDLYLDYRKELFKVAGVGNPNPSRETYVKPKAENNAKEASKALVRIDKLADTHPAVQYLKARRVPLEAFHRMFWTDALGELVMKSFPGKYDDECKKADFPQERLIYMLFAKDGELTGFQARSIDPNCEKRYRFLTFACEGHDRGFFGWNKLDLSKPHFVVEGPIDACFLPNAIAVTTSTIWRAELPDAIYFPDQEPRNVEVVKQIQKCVDKGYRVVLLSERYTDMDVNDIAKADNLNPEELAALFTANSYQGLQAKLKLTSWKK